MTSLARYALDLTQTHFVKDRGDYTLYGSWVGNSARPCLAILPKNLREGHLPLVITVDDAWKWNPDDQDARPEMNAKMIDAFLAVNNFERGPFKAMAVIGLVHDHLGDLLAIPPKKLNLEVVADALRTDADGNVTHKEIRSHA